MSRCSYKAIAVCLTVCSSPWVAAAELSYTRDVQPILASKCFSCHGFDPEHREADLRLDQFEGGDASGAESVIEVGDPEASSLIERVSSTDADLRMPPPHAGDALSEKEIAVLRQWIAEGATYERHWGFVPPKRPTVPKVKDAKWVRNPIDAFVLARLEQVGLSPSPQADKLVLARRLHLDLTGLPPSPKLVDVVDDLSMDECVDTLLDSPHYGERWGRLWLDAARYADSDGYEKDRPRSVWPYRDWVVQSLNDDLPFDEFVVRQVAGDLMPGATQDHHIATGFLRNSMINEEGGVDPEQFRMEALYDRMDAIGKSVLGVTLQCAQCHTHKYDPLSHTEYYRMFAYLNNTYEGSSATYTADEQQQIKKTLSAIRDAEQSLKAAMPDWRERLLAWAETTRNANTPTWTIVRPQLDSSGGQKHSLLADGSILAAGYAPSRDTTNLNAEVDASRITAIRIELLTHSDLQRGGPGRSPIGSAALTEMRVRATRLDDPSNKRKNLRFAGATADARPAKRKLKEGYADHRRPKYVTGPVEYAIDGKHETAWTDSLGPGRGNQPREGVFVLAKPLDSKAGFRLEFDLVQDHGGPDNDDVWTQGLGCFRISVTDAPDPKAPEVPYEVRSIIAKSPETWTEAELDKVFGHWRTTVAEWAVTNAEIESLWKQYPVGTTQLVLKELESPRVTHRLDRGDFLSPKEQVSPGVPSFLHPMEERTESPRLNFAYWLVDRKSPTAARSMVNRVWQAYFGRGLVATPDDFGVQCAPASHPELLDWLAIEFMEHDWSLKHLHRLIVSSATYQQASRVDAELLQRDPYNELLARGPRYRVDAEVVRDIALMASGLLDPTLGGPSIYPPAPEFLFLPPSSYGRKRWDYTQGPAKYRRGLYTFRYRSVPYPAFEVFDAPAGNVSCVLRSRSNTPLQALVTLNEPLYVECAQALAARMIALADKDDADRIQFAANCCLSRDLDDKELASLEAFIAAQRSKFASEPEEAKRLVGDCKLPKGMDDSEFAAWMATARVILNLDETITKE